MQDEHPSRERGEQIRCAIKAKYGLVAQEPGGRFPYPVGRASALGLGYEPARLDAAPVAVVSRFVGVGNPFSVSRLQSGDRVIDVGCGSGLDTLVAGHLVGRTGRAVGVDVTTAMLDIPRQHLGAGPLRNLEFVEADVERLPFEDGAFDRVISNGALNLVPDKDRAFAELRRVLRPGGTLAVVDLLVTETVPASVLADMDAWST